MAEIRGLADNTSAIVGAPLITRENGSRSTHREQSNQLPNREAHPFVDAARRGVFASPRSSIPYRVAGCYRHVTSVTIRRSPITKRSLERVASADYNSERIRESTFSREERLSHPRNRRSTPAVARETNAKSTRVPDVSRARAGLN